MRQPRRSTAVAATLAIVAVAATPHPSEAQNRVRPLGSYESRMVDMAREGAMRRLQSAQCRQVLTDFKDPQGRTPLENLAAFGVEPHEYVAQIPFLDGRDRPLCQRGQSQLLTTRGTARVLVCEAFLETISRERDMAEFYVIHEVLHTLGLDENPPSSQEITQQVKRRCSR
jgi:hypothetical protein